MQQDAKSFGAGRIVLLLAAMIAAFAIGYAAIRDKGDDSAIKDERPAIVELEKRVEASPKDAVAWQELGLAYFGEGQFAEAARAYGRATQADPEQALLWSALGEVKVMASERDPMPPDALEAFKKAVSLDKKDPRARYFLAVKRDLDGDHAGAIGDWLALLSDTPADAPWRDDLVRTIEQVGKINDIAVADRLVSAGARSPSSPAPVATRAIPGPTAQDLVNASRMPPGEQRDMAEGMVARLENRLENDPGNVDGWIMLMRSRMTLGEPAKAKQALADALAANPAKADFLNQQAGILGVR